MHFGIFTYGTRGDVQPYIALALGLKERSHQVTIAAPENFKEFVEGFGIKFHPLTDDVESMMNSPEGQRVLNSSNAVQLMKYFYKALSKHKVPLRRNYLSLATKADAIIANYSTLPILSAIAEKHQKKMALSYFMPPMAITSEFPVAGFDLFNFPLYNRLTYKIVYAFHWSLVKKETNEFRRELGLPDLTENLISYLEKQKMLDLNCFSPSLIPAPEDWASHHKITGFLTIPASHQVHVAMDKGQEKLDRWIKSGPSPIYFGFGSNGIGDSKKISGIIEGILNKTGERVLLCTGWANYSDLLQHSNLYVTKYCNHNAVIPLCKAAVFHGGAGTLATMLGNEKPVIIISFYTDQPIWGKIVERKKLGIHIPYRKISLQKMLKAISDVQSAEIKNNVSVIGQKIKSEDGLKNALDLLTDYFGT